MTERPKKIEMTNQPAAEDEVVYSE